MFLNELLPKIEHLDSVFFFDYCDLNARVDPNDPSDILQSTNWSRASIFLPRDQRVVFSRLSFLFSSVLIFSLLSPLLLRLCSSLASPSEEEAIRTWKYFFGISLSVTWRCTWWLGRCECAAVGDTHARAMDSKWICIFFFCPSPYDHTITFKSQLKGASVTSVHLIALFFILPFSTSELTERREDKRRLIPSLTFSSSFFQLEHTGCSLHPRRQTKKSLFPFPVVYFSPLDLLDQSFHSCDKQTDEWMDVTSFRLLIYKQTRRLFFKRKLYGTF